MRYLVALIVAGILISGGALFVWSTQRTMQQRVREAMQATRDPSELQAQGIDESLLKPANVGIELSTGELRRAQIADFPASLWFVLVPVLVLVCLGVAALTKWRV